MSKDAIKVHWKVTPENQRNGIILGYSVFFQETSYAIPHELNLTFKEGTHSAEIKNLKPYTNYSVRILAFNIIGPGPKSPVAIIETDQEGGWRVSLSRPRRDSQ